MSLFPLAGLEPETLRVECECTNHYAARGGLKQWVIICVYESLKDCTPLPAVQTETLMCTAHVKEQLHPAKNVTLEVHPAKSYALTPFQLQLSAFT